MGCRSEQAAIKFEVKIKSRYGKAQYPSGHVMLKRRRYNVVSMSVMSIQRCLNIV